MKTKTLLFCLLIGHCLALQAQTISVKSFQALPMDMTASSLEGKRIDQNGETAALIKVVTPETGFYFEGGTLGIVDAKQEHGEVWVWVPRGARKITVKHDHLGILRDYRYPIEIQAERTYEMVLTTAKIETIVKEEVRQQYLVFQISPPNATLEVNDTLWSIDEEGTAMKYVSFGTYTYRVRAANYIPDAGKVIVDDPEKEKTVNVTLKPNFASITLTVDAEAEIWVNNKLKGVRSWTGLLGNDTYKIECKQPGHETTIVSKEITTEMDGQTITLAAPKPIFGSLNVESTPNRATIYIDGKEMGQTPKSFNEILIGEHTIKLVKDGYTEHTEVVSIPKGERTQVKATLKSNNNVLQQSSTDNEIDMGLLDEAYMRKLKDIHASHILISCNKDASPSDTLKAYKKAMDIRKRALKGEDFGDLAERYSDDPSAKDTKATADKPARQGNRGDLGYFTVFDMVYPFETGAYNTKEGEISMPVRSDFGYHIIKVHSVTDAMGAVQAAHIFLQLPFDAPEEDVADMKMKADNIYQQLEAQNGKNWNAMVSQYSNDKSTIQNNGALKSFTVSKIVPEFVETCKNLEVGQYSKPVRSQYGFHIIKLLSKSGVGSFDAEYQDLSERLKKDMRSKEPK